jgi:RNA polymerase sigma factor (sigma-70 family)
VKFFLLGFDSGSEYKPGMTQRSDDSLPTRQTLLKRLKNLDDDQSWQDFFDIYWKLIYSVAAQAGLDHPEAQDVVQETVLSVAKKIGEYKADPAFGSFKSWLLLITKRRIADQFRRRPSGRTTPALKSGDTTRTPLVERVADPASLDWQQIWDDQWQKNLMEVAMERVKQQVSPRDWLLFYQQVVKEWRAGKVATKYNVSRASAYMAKYRISKLIKQEARRLEKMA